MKFVEGLGILGMIVLCQVLAPVMVLDLPSIKRIKVNSISVRPPRLANTVDHVSPDGCVVTYNVHAENPGNKTIISLESSQGVGNVLLENELQTIGSNTASFWYACDSSGGSGDLGVAIFGLPALLVTSPLLILNGLFWYALKLGTGMDRHALSFYLRVRSQLPKDVRLLLKTALRKL